MRPAYGLSYDAWSTNCDNLKEWEYFTKRAMTPRCSVCASVNLCFVASGAYDGYLKLDLQPWDMAASALIVKEAGEIVTSMTGDRFEPLGHSILAANPKINKRMLAGLKETWDNH